MFWKLEYGHLWGPLSCQPESFNPHFISWHHGLCGTRVLLSFPFHRQENWGSELRKHRPWDAWGWNRVPYPVSALLATTPDTLLLPNTWSWNSFETRREDHGRAFFFFPLLLPPPVLLRNNWRVPLYELKGTAWWFGFHVSWNDDLNRLS